LGGESLRAQWKWFLSPRSGKDEAVRHDGKCPSTQSERGWLDEGICPCGMPVLQGLHGRISGHEIPDATQIIITHGESGVDCYTGRLLWAWSKPNAR
jgi:hypothetical protein